MKKTLSILLFGIIATSTMAQEESGSDLRETLQFGAKIGMNYSNVYDSQGEEFTADPKYGLATGVYVTIPIGPYLGIQPEVLFSQKGFKGTGRLLGTTYGLTRTSNFIDVPLLVSFRPTSFISFLAGPQFSYLISQTNSFSNGISTIEQEQEFDNDNIRKNILGITGGFDITIEHVVLSGRAGWDLQRNMGDGSSTTPRYKNAWLQATVGYRFF